MYHFPEIRNFRRQLLDLAQVAGVIDNAVAEVDQYSGRGAPDAVRAKRDLEIFAQTTVMDAVATVPIGRIHEKGERHLEYRRHLGFYGAG